VTNPVANMQSITLLLCALFAFTLSALASPLPESAMLEKRVTHVGRGTWFDVGLGNCGDWNVNSDPIVAIGINRYQESNGGNCNQWVHITNTANGKTTYAKTRDSCQSCDDNSLDMSPHTFEQLASLDVGVLKISWNFMPKGWEP